MQRYGATCNFWDLLYGPEGEWIEEVQDQVKGNMVIEPCRPRKCTCGVKARYGIVPSELSVGYYCEHAVGNDMVSFMHIIYIFCFDMLCWLYHVNES